MVAVSHESHSQSNRRLTASSCSPISSERTASASFWGYPQSRAFAELLIDCEEDRMLRAVPVGMLRETKL
jgi:hypothetical protein